VDSAFGCVLFIDEAYSICRSNDCYDSYGQEAVDTLILRLENDRHNFIMIMAGYENDMNNFLNTNPGFKSRINRFIHFPDYSPEELMFIFEKMITEREYTIDNAATERVKSKINQDYNLKDDNFGNARYIRNLVEKIIVSQAERVMGFKNKSKNELCLIKSDDIPL
jgi:SpoVK/Ycf46/Vps4 family AAA+-type ATPase